MVPLRKASVLTLLLGSYILTAQVPGDPVMKARSERAQAQGIGEGDLPPVPRGIVEPPPLPPPETHVKDTRGYRPTKSRKHAGKASKGGAVKAAKATKSSKAAKQPAKAGRKSKKKGKG